MEQQPLFFEDFYDALRFLVQAGGGAKRIGATLYPEKTPEAAGRCLMDCLNPGRHEKLDPEQLMVLLRLGHEAGCHVGVNYLCGHTGYSQPSPLDPQDEKAELQKRFIASVTELRQLASRISGA
jgi:hypothetical protein